MKKIIYLMLTLVSLPSYAFDVGDYKTTYDANKDAYVKALNQYALSQHDIAVIVKLMGGRLISESLLDLMTFGSKGNSCSDLRESQTARSRTKVVPEITALLSDPMVQKVQAAYGNQSSIDDVLADVDSYYDQFDESVITQVSVLTERSPYADEANWFVYQPQFDLEDYATTFRSSRDRFLKAKNELDLATGPYDAAKTAYIEAVRSYLNYDNCADFGVDDSLEEVLADYTF